jgi:hypothetical protein
MEKLEIPHCRNSYKLWWKNKKYHAVGTVINSDGKTKNTTLSCSPPVFSGVGVTRSLVLCVCFVDRCLSFCTCSFGHCVVCSSSIYRFWIPLWYLQTRSTSGTRRVNLSIKPVISHEWGKGREVCTTSETYPWSFVTQIFQNDKPQMIKFTGCLPMVGGSLRVLRLLPPLKLERYILHMQVLLGCCYI